MAKITKFGTISETDEGDLLFDGFEFDMEFENEGEGDDMIKLIIDRIKSVAAEGEIEVNEFLS